MHFAEPGPAGLKRDPGASFASLDSAPATGYRPGVAIPLIVLTFAALSAAVVAYGTHPGWGGFEHGLELIVWSRRFQWPLVALTVVLCLILIGMVILGRRRAWWLIGLGPILALFVHHFAPFAPDRRAQWESWTTRCSLTSTRRRRRASNSAAAANALPADDDWVVGVTFGDTAYAYPYAALFRTPVVFQAEHGNRMVLFWSAYANRALAFRVLGTVRRGNWRWCRCRPNALLLFDTRRGKFINGLKGLTLDGRKPAWFGTPLLTTKTTWRHWRSVNPTGKVMAWERPVAKDGGAAPAAPTRPLVAVYSVPGRNGVAPVPGGGGERPRVTVVGGPAPRRWTVRYSGPARPTSPPTARPRRSSGPTRRRSPCLLPAGWEAHAPLDPIRFRPDALRGRQSRPPAADGGPPGNRQ